MRELKFKVKIQINHVGQNHINPGKVNFIESKIHDVLTIGFRYASVSIADQCDCSIVIRKDHCQVYELMQYTGLKDKNGVEIYEGDIVRILYTDWSSKPESDPRTLQQYLNDIANVGKVVFENNSWNISIYGKKFNQWYLNDIMPGKHGFIEVIGNIHENPELLK